MTELESLFENGITREGLEKIFNPYTIMKRLDDHFFSQEMYYELDRKTPYNELRLLPFYNTYLEDDKEKLFEYAIKTYLSYKENMPFFPTVKDWMKEISAPEEFIKKIIPSNGVDLSIILSNNLYNHELQIIFSKKIKKMEEIEQDNYDEGKFEFSEWYFDDYFSDRISSNVKLQWEKYLSKEFEIAKRLDDAWSRREHFYTIAKEKHLSVIETIMLFIDDAFKEYEDMISNS